MAARRPSCAPPPPDDTGFYAFGDYLFGLLGAGTYEVRVDASTLPGGLAQTYDLDDGTGPFASPNAATATLRLAERRLDVDFGYVGGGGQQRLGRQGLVRRQRQRHPGRR